VWQRGKIYLYGGKEENFQRKGKKEMTKVFRKVDEKVSLYYSAKKSTLVDFVNFFWP
jgi:hypothetical protein